ncbi:BTAD domain-containing putative transcriptional regulator [Streptomyces sp. NBC_01190]|uniref:BTAD domain-containing putative transcriptional regulator n=1 Tax=Streptomyces sp. NBC_01190 TaxID=2903767 RepID=UPI003869E8A3|nr:zeta toxin family protein [Streptomyces sp. NBC_01190]
MRFTALQDLVEAGIRWPELSRLHGERTAAYEDCFTAELARGRHHAVVEELRAAVERDPMRERMCALLMRALYRCGRQVEALWLYGRHRSALLDRLGLEPGRELRDLERAILNHDPALARSAAPSPSAPSRSATRRPPAAPAPPRPPGQAAPPRPTPHDPELAVLRGVLEYARRRRRPHLVLIVGGPGTGKSRLVAGLRNAVRQEEGAVRCVVGRPGAGALPDFAAALRRPGAEPTRDEAFAAWWSVLEQTAGVRPLVAVLEDVHDADTEVVRRLGAAVRASGAVPLVVVATARPEFLDAHPDWGHGLPSTTLELEDGR